MNKKRYIKPSLKVVEIDATDILATSPGYEEVKIIDEENTEGWD